MADNNDEPPKKPAAAAGVDNTARRTWDLDEYRGRAAARDEKAAASSALGGTKAAADAAANAAAELKRQKRLERDPLHQGLIAVRSNLKARDRELDLEARLGKTQMVVAGAAPSQQAGYYCSVCDCTLRDSQSYLDHINGKYHNRALGMSMRAERSTAEQVRQRLREASEAKAAGGGKRPRTEGGDGPSLRPPTGPGGALLLTDARAVALKARGDGEVALRDGIAARGSEEEEEGAEEEEEDDDGAGLLPPGAEAYVPDGFERRVLEAEEREAREREESKRLRAEKRAAAAQKRAQEEEKRKAEGEGEGEGGGDDDEAAMAAMMGFGGFGGGKKGGR
jgi:U4/U6.U5 tri-snRNP component SNU23